jgi:hypothetical protein
MKTRKSIVTIVLVVAIVFGCSISAFAFTDYYGNSHPDTKTITGATHDNTATAYYDASGRLTSTTYSWDGTNNHSTAPVTYFTGWYMGPGAAMHEMYASYVGDLTQTKSSVVSGPTRYNNSDGSYRIVTVYRGYFSGTLSVISWEFNMPAGLYWSDTPA